MSLLVLKFAALLLGVWAAEARELTSGIMPASARHEQWMAQYGRVYKDAAEKRHRLDVFRANLELIETFNAAAGKHRYKLGTNQFADLTNEEFKAVYNGLRPSAPKTGTGSFRYGNTTTVPSSIDWRSKGAVTPVKDQGQCGSCWAFSAVAATEGASQIKTGKLVSLAEQELVDCDVNGQDHGCEGGDMDDAFEFIIKNRGLTTEANYPYQAADGTCNTKKESQSAASISGYEDVPANDEDALKKAVAGQPISVAIDASSSSFQLYSSGVFTGDCGTSLDHGVTAVGYGTANDGTEYWLVKNSWGSSWGESGYIRMERGIDAKEGLCGIAMQASYPTV